MRLRVSDTSSGESDDGISNPGEGFVREDKPFSTGKHAVDVDWHLERTNRVNFFFDCYESEKHAKINSRREGGVGSTHNDSDWFRFTLVCHNDNQTEARLDEMENVLNSLGPRTQLSVFHSYGRPKFVVVRERIDRHIRYSYFTDAFPGPSEMQVMRIGTIVRRRKMLTLLGRLRKRKDSSEESNRKHNDKISEHLIHVRNVDEECDRNVNKVGKGLEIGLRFVDELWGLSNDDSNDTLKEIKERNIGISTVQERKVVTKEEVEKVLDSLICCEVGKAHIGKHELDDNECVKSLLSTSDRSSFNLSDILVDPGFKMKPQTWIVGNVGGASTVISGIPWSWLNAEKWRLHTFARYPHNAAKSAILLAEDGFAYNGSGVDSDDSVICYFCTGSKRGWREDENIRETHRDLNPTCPIVKGAKCNNVPMAAPTHVSFTSRGSATSGPAARLSAQGAQAQRTNRDTGSTHQRSESRQSTTGTTQYQAPIQPTDDGPSRTVTSNNSGTENNTSQSTVARSRSRNNNVPQSAPPSSSNTRGSPQTANQSTPVAQTTQSTPSAPVHQSNNQFNNPQAAPVNQSNNPQTAPVNQSNNTQTAPVNQSNNPQTAPVNQSNNSQTAPVNQTNTQETTPGNQTNSQNPTYYQLGIITERPKRHEYAVHQKRLDTFGDWPAGHHLKKEDLTDAGFYYAGYGDCARCFYCGGGLRNWEEGDDVWVEHARWFPKCAFIRQRVGQVFIDTVAFFAEDHEKITFKMVVDKLGVDPASFQIDSKETPLKNDPAVVTVKEMGYNEIEILRAATLHKENSQILSADELYETLETHGAVRHSVGNRVFSSIKPSSDIQKDRETLNTVKKNNSDLRLQYLCKVCMDKEVAIVFLPCGHLVCCTECSSAMRDCPVCRKSVKGVVRGFMA